MKETKKALLVSGLSLALCFVFMSGVTFAWFTDSVFNKGNHIKTGYAALQTHSPNTEITLDHCVLVGNNNFEYDEWNRFATVVINQTAGNTKLVLNDCTIHANQPTGNTQFYLSVRSENNAIELNNCKYVYNGTEQTLEEAMKNVQLYSTNNRIRGDGVEQELK